MHAENKNVDLARRAAVRMTRRRASRWQTDKDRSHLQLLQIVRAHRQAPQHILGGLVDDGVQGARRRHAVSADRHACASISLPL